jgi:glycosyltransferase involved in cell wall biosynthesis
MNIIMLSTDFLPNIGGLASHIFYLSQALKSLGHEVVVVNPVEKICFSVAQEKIDGLTVFRLTYPKTSNIFRRLWRRTQITLKVLHQIASPLDQVILHQHDHLNSTLAALFFSRNHKVRWVWTNHTSTFLFDMERSFKRLACELLYHKVDGVIGVSKPRLDKARSLFKNPKPGVFIPNGVDPNRFNPAVPPKRVKYNLSPTDFVILCPSRMMPVKGVIYLAQAVTILIERYPQLPWSFVFLGNEVKGTDATDKGYIEQVMQLLRQAYARGFVTYLGNVPPENMPGMYAISDLVVLPSLMEGAPLAPLEAMATQKPVIASRIEGFLELIADQKTGILVAPKNPEQLAQAIFSLYENRMLREQIAINGELLSQQYRWEHIAKQTADFYQGVLG